MKKYTIAFLAVLMNLAFAQAQVPEPDPCQSKAVRAAILISDLESQGTIKTLKRAHAGPADNKVVSFYIDLVDNLDHANDSAGYRVVIRRTSGLSCPIQSIETEY